MVEKSLFNFCSLPKAHVAKFVVNLFVLSILDILVSRNSNIFAQKPNSYRVQFLDLSNIFVMQIILVQNISHLMTPIKNQTIDFTAPTTCYAPTLNLKFETFNRLSDNWYYVK